MSPSTILDAFKQTNRIFETEVIAGRNIDALDRVYTRNARILPPGSEMVSGRENIKKFWQGAIDTLGVKAVTISATPPSKSDARASTSPTDRSRRWA